MQKVSLILTTIIGTVISMSSCSKSETAPSTTVSGLPAGPQDTVTSFMVYFTNTIDSSVEFGSYDDPDGPGPLPANIGGVALKKNSTYLVSISIEDGTNPKQIVFIDNKIKSKGDEYKICLSTPLGISVKALDSDGSMPIGLNNELKTTSTTGSDKINFTIKYQKGIKNGDCSPGVLYYTCHLPVGIY